MNCHVDVIELRKIMVERGYKTVGNLAKDSGISRNTLGKILNEKAKPSAAIMEKLIVTLKMDPETAGRVFFASSLRIA